MKPVYLDCNATTPLCPHVRDVLLEALTTTGNANSQLHPYGRRARHRLEHATVRMADAIGREAATLVPTSGATEAIRTALSFADGHVVTTTIEHAATYRALGADVTRVGVQSDGRVRAADVLAALRPDTRMVSLLHVNNETGAIQPVDAIGAGLPDDVLLHVDAAQSFGKLDVPERADLVSFSGHKLHAPVGIGGLVIGPRVDVDPEDVRHALGTPPVALWCGLAEAVVRALRERPSRVERWLTHREFALTALKGVAELNTAPDVSLPNVLNVRFRGLDAREVLFVLEDLVAASDGAACSSGGTPSHVLLAMGLSLEQVAGSVRFSWCHTTPPVPWEEVVARLG